MIKQFPSERIQFDEKSQKPIFELKENEEYEILMDNANNHSENDVKLIEFLSGKKIKIIPTQKGFFISVGSFVGSAEFKKFIIRIIPKFSEITKLPLLIDYAYELKDKDIVEDELRFESDIHFSVEWLIRPLVSRCQKLIKIGLTKSYVDVEDNLHYLRGRLLLAPQINNDAKMSLKFACEYDEFSSNIIENQIILFILKKSYSITQNDNTKQQIQEVIREFDMEVDDKIIQRDDFDIYYDRYNAHYEKIHLICKLIFDELGISNFYKYNTSYIFPIFINMSNLFEKYVAKLFLDYKDENKFIIKYDRKHTGRFAWETSNVESDDKKKIYPDLLIYSRKPRKELTIIADVKYMTSEKFDEIQLYQIAFYLNDYKKKNAYALIPDSNESKEITWKSIHQDISIHLKKIPIDEILNIIYSKSYNKDEQIKEILQEKIPIFNPETN